MENNNRETDKILTIYFQYSSSIPSGPKKLHTVFIAITLSTLNQVVPADY